MLAKLKFLRGTALDPFAWTKERRDEQGDLKDYLLLLDTLTAGLDAGIIRPRSIGRTAVPAARLRAYSEKESGGVAGAAGPVTR